MICTAQVKQLYEQTGRKVAVVGRGGVPQWSVIFENNPKIQRAPDRKCLRLINASGVRPYIAGKTATHWTWKLWSTGPGEIFLTAAEREFAKPHADRILIEPHTKVPNGNKAWFWERWQELVDRGGEFVQIGAPGTRPLRGVKFVETESPRHAAAVLAASRAFVGPEGFLHHAAAALSVPAVVLFSEFIHPDFTGYKTQRNLRHAAGACGSRLLCAGCRESMERISVDEVDRNLKEIING